MVHVPSQESRRRKSLLGARESLVKARTLLINSVRGYLRTQMLRVKGTPSCVPDPGAGEVRCRGRRRAGVHRGAAHSAIESLSEQIACVTKQIETIAQKDPLLTRLQTIPGVGPMTSGRWHTARAATRYQQGGCETRSDVFDSGQLVPVGSRDRSPSAAAPSKLSSPSRASSRASCMQCGATRSRTAHASRRKHSQRYCLASGFRVFRGPGGDRVQHDRPRACPFDCDPPIGPHLCANERGYSIENHS